MSLWRPLKGLFGDELVRHDGLGDHLHDPKCSFCESSHPTSRIFKCRDCGQFLQCMACCLSRHKLSPLHVLEVRFLLLGVLYGPEY